MKNTNAKQLIYKMLKQADMPILPGQNQLKKRNLKWQRFSVNEIQQRLNTLPEAPKNAITKKINEFKNEFAKMNEAQKAKYAGMLWVAYAEDRSVSEEVINYLSNPQAPNELKRLAETAKFVRNTGIQLPPNGTDQSIGSKYWISLFGYAYKGIQGFEVMTQQGNMNRQIKPYSGGDSPYPQGPLVIAPYGNGFRPIIRADEEIPVFAGQAPQNTRQFFKGNQLLLGKGVVYVPPAGHNNIVEDHIAENPHSNPNIHGNIVFHIDNTTAHNLVSNQPGQSKFIFGIYADENGCLYLRQRRGFKGKGSAALLDGENIYMTPQQILSILEPARVGVNHIVRPATSNEAIDYDGLVKGTRLVYTMSPDSENRLLNPNVENQMEWAVSAPALQSLRKFLEISNEVDDKDTHTSFEGFYLLMVGPKFIRAKDLGEGKALARPFVDPKSITRNVESPALLDDEILVDRDVHWVVVSNSISETRRIQNDRYYQDARGKIKTYLDEWSVVDEKENPQDALDKMVEVAAGKGGNIPRINARAESVGIAERSLQEARRNPSQIPLVPKEPIENPQNVEVEDQGPPQNADLNARAMSLIRRLNSNA